MEKQQSIMDTVNVLYDTFFEQEKKVASYIMKNHKEVINMTIGELAQASGTSVATITRFCRKCDLEGFHHLKIGLAREIVETDAGLPVSNDISRNNMEQSLQNIYANKMEELKQTISLIDVKILNKILDCIQTSRIVQLVAVGNTIPVALDGAYKLSEIGIKAVAGTIWETQLALALSLGKEDAMIAISNSGESKQVLKMILNAKENGVTTIGITNNPNSAIGSAVDYHIQTATREKLFLNEFCFSRVSAMTVMEIFYLFLTVGQPESYNRLSKCENLIANEKV